MENNCLPANPPSAYSELWPLFQKQVAMYNHGNTSLRDETAQGLMQGVRFTVELGGDGDLPTRFARGRRAIDTLLRKSRTLLAGVQKTAIQTENLSYTHTLAALPAFFKAYDKYFFPQDIPCDIDYQTALPMLHSPMAGVVWYHEYLRRILLENQLFALFPSCSYTALHRGAFPALKEDLVNLFTPVLLVWLACGLLGKEQNTLCIDELDRAALCTLLEDETENGLARLFTQELARLHKTAFPQNKALFAYSAELITYLTPGIFAAVQSKGLALVFPSPAHAVPQPAPSYEEGALLPAQALRALIAEARDCRHTSDKLALLRREIHNLRDFTDFMDNCLLETECPMAFALLAQPELTALCERLAREHPENPPYWGNRLLAYLRASQQHT